jgi:hypothetical protein
MRRSSVRFREAAPTELRKPRASERGAFCLLRHRERHRNAGARMPPGRFQPRQRRCQHTALRHPVTDHLDQVEGMGPDRSPAVRHARAWPEASGVVHDPLIKVVTHRRHLGPRSAARCRRWPPAQQPVKQTPWCYRLQRPVFQTCDSKPNLLLLQLTCRHPNSVFSSNQLKNIWILSRQT